MSDTPRVLLIKLSSLGDLFHGLPLAAQLERDLGARIDWVTQPEYVELVRCFHPVRRVIPFPRRRFISGLPGFIELLRAERYDLAIDLQGLLKSAFVTRGSRARRRIGPSFAREGTRWFYRELAGPADPRRHAVIQCLDAARHLDLEEAPPRFPLDIPEWGGPVEHPVAALVPCSRHVAKNWPLECFAEAGRRLQQAGVGVVLVGGPDERAACARLAAELDPARCTDLCGVVDLDGLLGVLREMDLVLTNDSGPMHMAAAVGTPVLALFGPTDPRRTGPFGEAHRVLQPPGVDGTAHDFRHGDASLIAGIPVDRVVAEALDMLGKRSGGGCG